MNQSADPVPAIAEADARGEIKDIYQDIRAVTGVGVVNLIWRRFAVTEGGLPFAWTAVRPLYVSGQVAAEGRSFRRQLQPPELPLLPKTALRAAGVDALGLRSIRAILDSYDRTNAMNLIGLGALRVRLEGGDIAPAGSAAPAQPTAEKPLPPIPPLPALDALDPDMRALVDMLNGFGEEDGRVIASMYRHLAYWPGYLALIWALLAPLAADGRLQATLSQTRKLGRSYATAAASGVDMSAADGLAPAVLEDVRDTLVLFTDHPISKMSAICRALASATPAP